MYCAGQLQESNYYIRNNLNNIYTKAIYYLDYLQLSILNIIVKGILIFKNKMLSQNKQGSMDKFVANNDTNDNLLQSSAKVIQDNPDTRINFRLEVDTNEVRVKNFKARIENASSDELPDVLDELIEKWELNNDKHNYGSRVSLTMVNFRLKPESLTIGSIDDGYKESMLEVLMLRINFQKLGLMDEDDPDVDYRETIFNRLKGMLFYSKETLIYMHKMFVYGHQSIDTAEHDNDAFFTFQPIDKSRNNAFQNLLLYMLRYIHEREYKRIGDNCARKVYTEDGQFTRAYESHCTIKSLVYQACQKEVNYDQWHNMTVSKDNAANVTKHLTNAIDTEFNDLVSDRHVFSFKNGVYITSTDTFVPYEESGKLDSDIIACNYFDKDFPVDEYNNNADDWFDIKTPSASLIMDDQRFDEDVQKVFWIMMGRVFYEVNEIDGWQVVPFCKGQAGSGKSTVVLKIVKQFYPPNEVGVISNNIERKFGLQPVEGKLLFVAPEVKVDFGLDQADFQTAVSGEETVINRKFETAKTVRWTIPGFFAGNEIPGWCDNSESLSRRWIPFQFNHKPKNLDPFLGDKLAKELPRIMLKANRAYLEAVKRFGGIDIWKWLPKYFIDQRKMMAEQTNTLVSFISSEMLSLDMENYMLESEFKNTYKSYCNANSMTVHKWTSDYWQGPFAQNGIERLELKKVKVMPDGASLKGWVLKGVAAKKQSDDIMDI